MSKVKTIKDSTLKLKDKKTTHTPKNSSFYEFIDLNTWEVNIVSESLAMKMATEFLNYARNDKPGKKAYNVCDFYIARGISREDFYKIVEIFPCFAKAYKTGLEAIGSRRMQGAMACEEFKPLNEKAVCYSQHLYDPDHKSSDAYHDERKRKLAEEERKTGGTFIIEMSKGKDCKEVPVCEEEK